MPTYLNAILRYVNSGNVNVSTTTVIKLDNVFVVFRS